MVEVSLIHFDVSEVSEYKELARVNNVPKIIEVFLHADLSHLAHFNQEKHGQWNKADYVAHFGEPLDLYDALNDDWADESDHVEQEEAEEKDLGFVELWVHDWLHGIEVVETRIWLILNHQLCQAKVIKNWLKIIEVGLCQLICRTIRNIVLNKFVNVTDFMT